jgi:hypothetical protein
MIAHDQAGITSRSLLHAYFERKVLERPVQVIHPVVKRSPLQMQDCLAAVFNNLQLLRNAGLLRLFTLVDSQTAEIPVLEVLNKDALLDLSEFRSGNARQKPGQRNSGYYGFQFSSHESRLL